MLADRCTRLRRRARPWRRPAGRRPAHAGDRGLRRAGAGHRRVVTYLVVPQPTGSGTIGPAQPLERRPRFLRRGAHRLSRDGGRGPGHPAAVRVTGRTGSVPCRCYTGSPSVPIRCNLQRHIFLQCPGIRTGIHPSLEEFARVHRRTARRHAQAVRRPGICPAAGPGRDGALARSTRTSCRSRRTRPRRSASSPRRCRPGSRARRDRPQPGRAHGVDDEHGTPAASLQHPRHSRARSFEADGGSVRPSGCSIARRGSSSIGQSGGLISRWFQVRVLAPLPT